MPQWRRILGVGLGKGKHGDVVGEGLSGQLWWECRKLNLSYQELGAPSQLQELTDVLSQADRLEIPNLNHNILSSLNGVSLECLVSLDVSFNNFSAVRDLPHMPLLKLLNLYVNHIPAKVEALRGLPAFGQLERLVLDRNPCSVHSQYRKLVREATASVRVLDGAVLP